MDSITPSGAPSDHNGAAFLYKMGVDYLQAAKDLENKDKLQ